MVVTRCGASGLAAANHAQVELSVALVHAPILRQQTEEEAAGDWDEIKGFRDVTHINAQVNVLSSSFLIYAKTCGKFQGSMSSFSCLVCIITEWLSIECRKTKA